MDYEIVVGLEVHAELNTETKIYCSCKNSFGSEVNSNCCPVCTGMPGFSAGPERKGCGLRNPDGSCPGL